MAIAQTSSHIAFSSTTLSPLTSHPPRHTKIFVKPMNSFAGLKSHNLISSLGQSPDSDRLFAQLVARCSVACRSRGGAAASTCDLGSEIFRVVPIITALVLIGVALGFVLLRVEAALEESED